MNYYKIEKNSISNGIGVRTVMWCSGCTVQCKGCHNPKLWDFDVGQKVDDHTAQEVIKELQKPYISGLTLTGGNPLEFYNFPDLTNFLRKIREYSDKSIWIYTGYMWEYILLRKEMLEAVKLCDIIVDGPYMEDKRDITLPFRGSSNQRIIDIQKSLKENKVILWGNDCV